MAGIAAGLELLGAGALIFGVWLLSPPAAFILSGLLLLLLAQGVGRTP